MQIQPEEFLTRGHIVAGALPSSDEVRLDLAAEVLRRFGEVRFVARGSSMIPSIFPGDFLTVRSQVIEDTRHGQIVLCLREGRFWAHRVMRKWREGSRFVFATRGDALSHEDPSLDESQVLGRVTSIVRYGKPVDFARINSLWTRILRCGVRNSNALTKTLLRRHSLRLRLLGRSHDALGNSGTPFLECM
jgi:Peptidase S24-like